MSDRNIIATRRIQFCCGHRVKNHESKCRNMHGHNYVLFCHVKPKNNLDSLGRVVDFGVMKQLLGTWIDENWDHGFVYWVEDEEVEKVLSQKQKTYILPWNPMAENMAKYLLERICPILFSGHDVEAVSIELWETENCKAEVSNERK